MLPSAVWKSESLRGKSHSYRQGDTRKQHLHDDLPFFLGRIIWQSCHSFCDGSHGIALSLSRPGGHTACDPCHSEALCLWLTLHCLRVSSTFPRGAPEKNLRAANQRPSFFPRLQSLRGGKEEFSWPARGSAQPHRTKPTGRNDHPYALHNLSDECWASPLVARKSSPPLSIMDVPRLVTTRCASDDISQLGPRRILGSEFQA